MANWSRPSSSAVPLSASASLGSSHQARTSSSWANSVAMRSGGRSVPTVRPPRQTTDRVGWPGLVICSWAVTVIAS